MSAVSSNSKGVLNRPFLNGWTLFTLLAAVMSAAMIREAWSTGLVGPAEVSHMIGYSVRWSIPFIFLVAASSALQTLFPSRISLWLLRNRKYLGLSFAVAMAWQGLFIAIISTIHSDYYYDEIFYFRDELEGSTGYLFLTAMVITSFRFGRQLLSQRQWKFLHRTGMYFLWAYPFSTYWWSISYYPNPQIHDYIFYLLGFLAVALRIAAWGKKRRRAAEKNGLATPLVARVLGIGFVAAGLAAAVVGLRWQEFTTELLTSAQWSATLELWLPFWPFEPFLPLFAIGIGAMLMTTTPTASDARVSAT
ncbi:MAG: hypothetical protein AAGA23_20915 [Pseudomonadota bacterium]